MGNAGYGNHTESPGEPDRPGTEAGRMRPPEKQSESQTGKSDQQPPAGPHADPSLVNPDATPGAGTLTPPGGHDDVDSTSG